MFHQPCNTGFLAGSSGEVRFNKDGDRPGSYDLYQYQRINNNYKYVPIGSWRSGNLTLKTSDLIWGGKSPNNMIPASVCSLPCAHGHIRKKREGDECCWVCTKCEYQQYRHDEWTCRNCTQGTLPDENRTGCDDIFIEYLHWSSPWAIVPVVMSILGILSTLYVIAVFVYYNDTPVIRASGRELCYVTPCRYPPHLHHTFHYHLSTIHLHLLSPPHHPGTLSRHLLFRALYQNKPRLQNIQQRQAFCQETTLYQSSLPVGHLLAFGFSTGDRCGRVVGTCSAAN